MRGTEATLYDVIDGAAWITLNRPAARNALSPNLVAEFDAHLTAANADPAVRCIVITGADPAFCAGADLKAPRGASPLAGMKEITFPDVLQHIQDSDKPVIAAVNGAAYAGGLGIIGAADIVITAEDAPFSFSEVRIGVIPAIIAVTCLPKLGPHHAMRLFLTGERFDGRRAVELGLAHRAVPKGDLRAAVGAEVATIALGGPLAVVAAKKLVRQVAALARDEAFAAMQTLSASMFVSPEGQEGMAAFREKRPPAWVKPSTTP
ncbi:MAG: enoyl-CoA hydratase-related protein [Alphaproteobacteria bacterium]|nr:enoyl-CoA hydratase-related protein [Alphaproteobacteria bacterium]